MDGADQFGVQVGAMRADIGEAARVMGQGGHSGGIGRPPRVFKGKYPVHRDPK